MYNKEATSTRQNLADYFQQWHRELEALDEITRTRNTLTTEYLSLKAELREKKLKILNSPKEKPDFDTLAIKYSCIDRESDEFNRQKHKFLLAEVVFGVKKQTKAARKMADCVGFVNHWVYLQILGYQRARAEKSLANLDEFCQAAADHNEQVSAT